MRVEGRPAARLDARMSARRLMPMETASWPGTAATANTSGAAARHAHGETGSGLPGYAHLRSASHWAARADHLGASALRWTVGSRDGRLHGMGLHSGLRLGNRRPHG